MMGESVTEAESARDQIAAFAVHVPKRREPPFAPWLRIPEPDLSDRLARLDALIEWAHEFEDGGCGKRHREGLPINPAGV